MLDFRGLWAPASTPRCQTSGPVRRYAYCYHSSMNPHFLPVAFVWSHSPYISYRFSNYPPLYDYNA